MKPTLPTAGNFDSDLFYHGIYYRTSSTHTTPSGTKLQRTGSLGFIFDPNNQSQLVSMATTFVVGVAIATSPYIARVAIHYAAELSVRAASRLIYYGWQRYRETREPSLPPPEEGDEADVNEIAITIQEEENETDILNFVDPSLMQEKPPLPTIMHTIREETEEEVKSEISESESKAMQELLKECAQLSSSMHSVPLSLSTVSSENSLYCGFLQLDEARVSPSTTVSSTRDIDNCEISDDVSIFSWESIERQNTPLIIEEEEVNHDEENDDDHARQNEGGNGGGWWPWWNRRGNPSGEPATVIEQEEEETRSTEEGAAAV